MSWGGADRGGSREGKKSLRKNKIAINKFEKKMLSSDREVIPSSKTDNPPLPLYTLESNHPEPLIDCGCSLVNRRFQGDFGKIVTRGHEAGVQSMMVLSNDFEKQKEILDIAKLYEGALYCMIGIHPDNVKRTNDKTLNDKMDQLKKWALVYSQAVALSCGLDFTREVATHYTQEKVFKDHLQLSLELEMPVVIFNVNAFEQITDHLRSVDGELKKIAIYNFYGSQNDMDAYNELGIPVYFIITGVVCENSDRGDGLRSIVKNISKDRILVATDAPFNTPQNISDAWVRERHNEPSNLPFVVEILAKSFEITVSEMSVLLKANSKEFFGLMEKDEYAKWKSEREPADKIEEQEEEEEEEESETEEVKTVEKEKKTGQKEEDDEESKKKKKNTKKTNPEEKFKDVVFSKDDIYTGKSKKDIQKKKNNKGNVKEEVPEEEEKKIPKKGKKEEKQLNSKKGSKKNRRQNLSEEEEEDNEEPENSTNKKGKKTDKKSKEKPKKEEKTSTLKQKPLKESKSASEESVSEEEETPIEQKLDEKLSKVTIEDSTSNPAPTSTKTNESIRYACKKCRRTLFTSSHLKLSHDTVEASSAIPANRNRKNRQKGPIESDVCRSLFVHQLKWMRSSMVDEEEQSDESNEEENSDEDSNNPTFYKTEGKLSCPECDSKLGRWSTAAPIQCSCGQIVPAPVFMIPRNNVDAVLDLGDSVDSLALLAEMEEEDDDDNEDEGKKKSRKKRFKQQRTNTGNFSSFRNKSY